jgi:hypothetical protein
MSKKWEQKKLAAALAKADEKKQNEERKIAELKQQFEDSKQLDQLVKEGKASVESSMSWMYKPQTNKAEEENEEVLLGKKKVQPRFFVEEYMRVKEKEVPGALFIDTSKYQGPERDAILQTLDNYSKDRVRKHKLN